VTSRRVLYVAWAPFFSGAERALLLTLKSLAGTGYDPRVLAGTDGEFSAEVRKLGIPCDVAPIARLEARRPIAGLRSVAAVLKSATRHRASLVHANEVASYQPAGYAARVLGVPAIAHVRFVDTNEGFRWFLRPRFSRAVFVSRAFLEAAQAEAPGLFDERGVVIYDAVEPQPVWTDQQVAQCRRELGIPADRLAVALTGQVAEVKGIWDFVESARLLAARRPETMFVVLGDDLQTRSALRLSMEARVQKLGLSERFRFLGFRRDAPQIVQSFDVVAVPSHVEPLGLAALEAMAAGRPVVGSRVGGIPETVVDGETGLLVEPRRPDSLAAALDVLVGDPALRRRMGAAGRQRAEAEFATDRHARSVQHLYDEILAPAAVHGGVGSELA